MKLLGMILNPKHTYVYFCVRFLFWVLSGGFYGPINYYRAALWDSRNPLPSHVIETPTLVIWGDKDVALDPQLAHVPKKYVSNLTTKHVENASHWVQVDKPDVVNKHIREFLKGK